LQQYIKGITQDAAGVPRACRLGIFYDNVQLFLEIERVQYALTNWVNQYPTIALQFLIPALDHITINARQRDEQM
jgi:hypothetical protein